MSFKAAQQTNKILTSTTIEEQVHYTATLKAKKPPGRVIQSNEQPCYFCGKPKHPLEKCPARRQTCNYCHKTGHFANVCQQAARDTRTLRPVAQKTVQPGPKQENLHILSTDASKSLGALAMNTDFVRKCTATDRKSEYSTTGSPTPLPNTSTRAWPKPGSLTMEFISQNCTSLFQGLDNLGPPVDFDMDPNVKPTHAPFHRQPISKLEKIKASLDAYEATGQLIRVSQSTAWISNMVVREREPTTTKPGKIRICLIWTRPKPSTKPFNGQNTSSQPWKKTYTTCVI